MLIQPHGGRLIDRMVPDRMREEVRTTALNLPRLVLGDDQVKEVWNIAHGVLSPIEGYFTKAQCDAIVGDFRLPNGEYWTIPILLPVSSVMADEVQIGGDLTLADNVDRPFAMLHVEDIFSIDKQAMAQKIFATTDLRHPGVNKLMSEPDTYIGGKIDVFEQIEMPFKEFLLTPKETRFLFRKLGWNTVAAFQTRNPPHRAHEYLQKCALEICDGLFINPVIGRKKPGDFTDNLIMKAYQALIDEFYPINRVALSILPWEMRYAGPIEAIFHCIVRKNFGCSHHIVGRDHAGVGDYYHTYAAHWIFREFPDLGIEPLFFDHSFYCKICKNMATAKTCPHGKENRMNPSGTLIRAIVTEHAEVAEEIMRPEIATVLASSEDPFVK